MNSDRAPIRDRTLILRLLVPGLEARLRDKMKEVSDSAAGNSAAKDSVFDLEGVTCEPTTARNHTLWNFHCDGATYPAKLVNLPCPVELHKTHDHAAYYKCVDVAQMLIVYEDEMALEEAASSETVVEGFPSYYHSGLTPPMHRVVERRFAAREHSAVAPPRQAVQEVELEVIQIMERIALQGEKVSATKTRQKAPVLTSANKILEEVVEEVVDFEPWMDDYGNQATGVEFNADEQLCTQHPEVWLPPEVIRQLRDEALLAQQKKLAAAEKKKEKKKQKEQTKKKPPPPSPPKQEASLDEVTAAAMGNIDDLDLDAEIFLEGLDIDGDEIANMDLGDMEFNL